MPFYMRSVILLNTPVLVRGQHPSQALKQKRSYLNIFFAATCKDSGNAVLFSALASLANKEGNLVVELSLL